MAVAPIRETTSAETPQILALYPQAFPDEELRPVVSALLIERPLVLSLAAFDGDALVGHILFTRCGTEEGDRRGALLVPLGVLPAHQRRGVGGALVRAGLERLERDGVDQAFVLGDPAYYARFGFAREDRVRPPYPTPDAWREAWRSLSLGEGPPERPVLAAGTLRLPTPWMRKALWTA